ncbi:MAG: YigZ family protein [Candidatus Eisenbacteria bacterium]
MGRDPDIYRAVDAGGTAETKVKGSRFLGLAFPAPTVEVAEEMIEALRKKHFDATHVCFAWRVGHGQEEARRMADAGEPSGTAGTPIMQVLERSGVSDGGIAVIRWFGGVKLGTGGLIRAYGECAGLALEAATIGERVLRKPLEVSFTYPQASAVLRLAERYGALADESHYGEEARIRFAVPASKLPIFRDALVDATAGTIRFLSQPGSDAGV